MATITKDELLRLTKDLAANLGFALFVSSVGERLTEQSRRRMRDVLRRAEAAGLALYLDPAAVRERLKKGRAK